MSTYTGQTCRPTSALEEREPRAREDVRLAQAPLAIRELHEEIDMGVGDHLCDHIGAPKGVANPDAASRRTAFYRIKRRRRPARRTTIAVVAALTGLAVVLLAGAATPSYKGTVGPGFTIAMTKKPTKAGKVKIVVTDKAEFHNFHLTGPGST